jgi:hypothetical protein
MKQLIFLICALFACINTAKAQVTISTSDLSGTKWQLDEQYDDNSKVYYEYTDTTMIWHKSDGSTLSYPYYLSDTIPTDFDYTKVGQPTKGHYFVECHPQTGRISCYSFKSFSKSEGTMVQELESKDVIISTDTFNFIMIPSSKPRGNNAKPYEGNW